MNKKIIVATSLFLLTTSLALADVSQQDVQRYSAYYSNGMQYLKNGQYSSSISEFKKVLRFSPYDATTREALANAYIARAEYYRQTTKELKKALDDYKSAYFYSKYWQNDSQSAPLTQLANNAQGEINSIERRLQIKQDPASRLQNAKILKAKGELAAAGYDFQALKNTQYKEIAYENLGSIYKHLNNVASAMDYMKSAIDINPKNPKLHFLYGVMLDEANNFEASMEQYNLALQYGDKSPELLEILENKWTQNIVNNPSDAQGYINLGAIYQKQGNFDAAKSQYLKASQMDSSDDTALYNLASLYVQQKNYQSAINTYDKLLAKKPNNIEVLNYKASALKELMRYDEALKQYEKILALEPNNKDAKIQSEDIILNHFSGQKLQNYLALKANNNPKSYEAQFNYAFELHKNKNYSGAIQYYQKALNLNPAKEEVYLNLAQIYLEQKNFNKASEICQRGLLVLPGNPKINQYLADAKNYASASKFEQATKQYELKQYSKALSLYMEIQQKTPEVNLAIASCYSQLKDYQNANKYYLEVLSKDPSNIDALINSAWAYYAMNDFLNAKLTANKVLAYDKTNKEAKDLLDNIEQGEYSNLLQDAIQKYEQGDYQNALNLVNKVIASKSDDEYAIYYKGLIFDELKKPKDAIKQYKLLISKNPSFASAYYSLAVDLDESENYNEAVLNYEKFLSIKASLNEKDEMTTFSENRLSELKKYLDEVNGSKK